MAFITSPTIVRVKDRNGTLIVPVCRTFVFTGSVGVTQTNPSEATINILGSGSANGGDVIYGSEYSAIIGFGDNGILETGTGQGTLVLGRAENSGSIVTGVGHGAIAFGLADAFNISSTANGSIASGHAVTGDVQSLQDGAVTVGDDLIGNSQYGQTFGIGHNNRQYLAAYFGRYSLVRASNPTIWDPLDPLFILGAGLNDGGPFDRFNAFEIFKDGLMVTTASTLYKAVREVDADTAVDRRSDRTIYCDSSVAPIVVTLFDGEDGDTGFDLYVADSGQNASVNNITFVTSGGDTIEPGADITLDNGYVHLQYFDQQWRILGKSESSSVPSTQIVEYVTLDATDIANQFITLANTPLAGTVLFFAGKLAQFEGDDWSIAGDQLTFLGDLATGGPAALVNGDKVIVSYSY